MSGRYPGMWATASSASSRLMVECFARPSFRNIRKQLEDLLLDGNSID